MQAVVELFEELPTVAVICLTVAQVVLTIVRWLCGDKKTHSPESEETNSPGSLQSLETPRVSPKQCSLHTDTVKTSVCTQTTPQVSQGLRLPFDSTVSMTLTTLPPLCLLTSLSDSTRCQHSTEDTSSMPSQSTSPLSEPAQPPLTLTDSS